ncbi:MAG: thioredoxin domain-containing protein [Gammaproteobacteria bacterium]
MMNPASATSPVKRYAITLTALSLAALAVTLYQWVELAALRSGGNAPLCTISATFNCAGVWNSSLSESVHRYTGIPVAGWGVAWSVVALILSGLLWQRARQTQPAADIIQALRLITGAGALIALLLLGYSAAIKVFCPTCIVFYALVWGSAWLAFFKLKPDGTRWAQPALLTGGVLAVTLAALIYPGLRTPVQDLATAALSTVTQETGAPAPSAPVTQGPPLEQFLASLPPGVQEAVSFSLDMYRKSKPVPGMPDPKRVSFGPALAPVHLVEWTDIRCPHCKNMEQALEEIRRITQPGSWTQESRHYPLDTQCNRYALRDGGGISCLAARVQICLRGTPELARVRGAMFAQQDSLSIERIWQISAGGDTARRKSLETCVNSPETGRILQEDIESANKHDFTGTPLVVINGRKGTAAPAFIYGMILAQGRDNDPAFAVLPPPPPQ